jgi:hypothetical protein
MSRGPGRWQRLLLHELYHGTLKRDPFFGRLELSVWHLTSTSGEPDYSTARYTRYAAARRAGRSLIANGLATGCPLSGQRTRCIGWTHRRTSPVHNAAVSVPNWATPRTVRNT